MIAECCNREESGSATCEIRALHLATEQHGVVCPVCRTLGKPVQGQTVKAMLAVSLRAVEDVDFRFCRTPECPVVYYAEDGIGAFTVEQVRERVYEKEPTTPEVLVCYCFRHTIAAVLAVSAEGQRAIVDDITRGIQVGQCACDLRNPRGSCCLGNVRVLVRQHAR